MNNEHGMLRDVYAAHRYFDLPDLRDVSVEAKPLALLALLFFASRHGTSAVQRHAVKFIDIALTACRSSQPGLANEEGSKR